MYGLLTKFGQDRWIFAKFYYRMFKDGDGEEVHKLAKRELGQYPAWSKKDLLCGVRRNFSCLTRRIVPLGEPIAAQDLVYREASHRLNI